MVRERGLFGLEIGERVRGGLGLVFVPGCWKSREREGSATAITDILS